MNKTYMRLFTLFNLFAVIWLGDKGMLPEVFLLLILLVTGIITARRMNVSLYKWLKLAMLGALCESLCIYFGVWEYAVHSFLNIPLWLPFLWGNAALFFRFEFSHSKK